MPRHPARRRVSPSHFLSLSLSLSLSLLFISFDRSIFNSSTVRLFVLRREIDPSRDESKSKVDLRESRGGIFYSSSLFLWRWGTFGWTRPRGILLFTSDFLLLLILSLELFIEISQFEGSRH